MPSARNRPPTSAKIRRAAQAGLRPGASDLRVCLVLATLWLILHTSGLAGGVELQRVTVQALRLAASTPDPEAALLGALRNYVHLASVPLAALCGVAVLGIVLPPRLRSPWRSLGSHEAKQSAGLGALARGTWSGVTSAWCGVLLLGLIPRLGPHVSAWPLHGGEREVAQALGQGLQGVIGLAALGMALAAPLGLWIERFRYLRALRMTDDDLRREHRAQFGDPRPRRLIRQRAEHAEHARR